MSLTRDPVLIVAQSFKSRRRDRPPLPNFIGGSQAAILREVPVLGGTRQLKNGPLRVEIRRVIRETSDAPAYRRIHA